MTARNRKGGGRSHGGRRRHIPTRRRQLARPEAGSQRWHLLHIVAGLLPALWPPGEASRARGQISIHIDRHNVNNRLNRTVHRVGCFAHSSRLALRRARHERDSLAKSVTIFGLQCCIFCAGIAPSRADQSAGRRRSEPVRAFLLPRGSAARDQAERPLRERPGRRALRWLPIDGGQRRRPGRRRSAGPPSSWRSTCR